MQNRIVSPPGSPERAQLPDTRAGRAGLLPLPGAAGVGAGRPAGRAGIRALLPVGLPRWAAVPGVLFLLAAAVYLGLSSYMALKLTRPERRPFNHFPEQYGLSYESVNFPSRVG